MPPPPGAVPFPQINGTSYDFSSVTISIDAFTYEGFKNISYKHKLTPGELRGNHPAIIGRTRGSYAVESVTGEMWKADYQTLVDAIRLTYPTVGYMEASFPITVQYGEVGSPLLSDVLTGCRIMSDEHGGAEGADASTVKLEFHAMRLFPNGAPAIILPGFQSLIA